MAPASVDLTAPNGVKWAQPTGLFINNEFAASSSGQTLTSIDPATEEEITSVQAADAHDIDKAVRAAKTALRHDSWKNLPASDRGQLMARLADLIEAKRELFATIDAWDNGKTYTETLENDLVEAVGVIRYYSGWADKTFGQTINTTPQKFAYTIRQPVGVVAQIIPWNYPLSMATWKLGPALACGNTVVIKAAEQTPLSLLVLGELVKEAGFPPGVVNIVNGLGKDTGAALVQHPLVDKIAFTGSTATAASIMGVAAKTLKNITLETGGKSPLLVFDDAELEQAVKWSHFGIMSNQGQICTATSRILVQETIYKEFIQKFISTLNTVSKVGNQWDKDTYQGPQVSKVQYERILEYIDIGKKEGATLAAGGHPLKVGNADKGFYIAPTVFTDVKPCMRVFREEIFGPVVVISTFETEEEAIDLANDTTYGLGAAAFTTNLDKAHRVAAAIEAGMVWINSSQDCDPRVPFGGVKQSGIGRELGEAGLEAYTQIKPPSRTGASGYVGGQLLRELVQAHPEYTIAALVRDAHDVETISQAYPKVRIVQGDLDHVQLVEQEASQASVVLMVQDVASNKHISSLQAMHRGLQKRQSTGYLVQISGASLLGARELASPSFKPGEPSDQVWDDLDRVTSLQDLIRATESRVIDNYMLKAAKETPSVKTALVLPPIIYGKGQGPAKQRSVQIPALAKVAIERGHAVRAGRGLARWTNIHVADLARLFTRLAEAGAESNDDGKLWGEEGIYLPGVGEITWADISDRVAQAAKEQGLIDTLQVEELYKPQVDTALPAGSVFFGSNARSKPRRATEVLGWKPTEAGLEAEIPRAVAEEAESGRGSNL
ncbi:hypothetical protein F66182_3866 [Fusarium sp. NRRL 66182]|nr:hypothetical protein F66182_3866 [Fusarium sp. NRRL 66182]